MNDESLNNSNYSAQNIQVLEGLEAVRKRLTIDCGRCPLTI